jgi:transcriptional regulator with XRE-family HTH domain
MTRTPPPPMNLALAFLRLAQGWSQRDLGEAAGISPNLLSDYERGRKPLSRPRLEKIVATMGLAAGTIDTALKFLREVRAASAGPGSPSDEQRRRIEAVAVELGAGLESFARETITRFVAAGRAEREREQAATLWESLRKRKPEERRRLVEEKPELRSWALCELICRASIEAAHDDAARALELAELALRIAELAPAAEAWRSRLQGYAWAHVGNARRVRSDLPGAEEAFRRASKLWRAGTAEEADFLPEARLLDLEASLRRDQGQFAVALELLDRALAVDRGELTKRLLLNKATVLEAQGDFGEGVAVLLRAATLVESSREPRLLFALRFNLAVNLWFLSRYDEVGGLLPELRKLAAEVGNELDLVRLRWLEGRIAAGFGRRDQALVALSRVREEFASRGIAYDVALVSLELARLHLEEGRTAEVRSLARQMIWIFSAQGVPEGVLAALKIFCEAAERDAVTLDLARRLADYLFRAQTNPDLRFEMAP